MAGGFMHRVISYVANEFIVNGLANSKAFQRFAVNTSKSLEDLTSMAAQKQREVAEKVKDFSKSFEEVNK